MGYFDNSKELKHKKLKLKPSTMFVLHSIDSVAQV